MVDVDDWVDELGVCLDWFDHQVIKGYLDVCVGVEVVSVVLMSEDFLIVLPSRGLWAYVYGFY